jgi:transcriptional regulator with XRE-family HTH domain
VTLKQEPKQVDWGRLVKTLRVLRGWSRRQLAKAVGVHKATIDKQEQGLSRPTPETKAQIENALGIEGHSGEVGAYLAELQQTLLRPERRRSGGEALQVGLEASRRMQAALWAGLEELRGGTSGKDEPGLPPGVLIVTLRTLLGWNREEICRRAEVHWATMSRLESGKGVTDSMREEIEQVLGLEGIRESVRLELCGLRAMMRASKSASVRQLIAEAGEASRRLIEDGYRLGLEELLEMEPPRTVRPAECDSGGPLGPCLRGPWD